MRLLSQETQKIIISEQEQTIIEGPRQSNPHLFVCLLLNGSSALFRLLVTRIDEVQDS